MARKKDEVPENGTAAEEDLTATQITAADADEEENENYESIYAPEVKKVTTKTRAADPSIQSEDDLIFIAEKRRVYELDRDEAKKRYRQSDVITAFGDEQAQTQLDSEYNEKQTLMASVRSNVGKGNPLILRGTVTGYTKSEHGIFSMLCELENSDGIYKIMIPISMFTYDDISKYYRTDDENFTNLKNYCLSYLDAKVPFIVFELNEKARTAYASRIAALEKLSRYYYRKPFKGNQDRSPRLHVGLAATADVISVSRDRLVAHVCGVDCVMTRKELDYVRRGPLDNDYVVGDRFNVKIIEDNGDETVSILNRNYVKPVIKVSKRALEKDPKDIYYDWFKKDDVVVAETTSENQANGIYVCLRGKMPAMCPPIPMNVPIGSTCKVIITEKDDAKRQIRGYIIPSTIRPPRNA